MPLVNPPLPNQGQGANATDISVPFLALLAVFNGNIGADNLQPGTIINGIANGAITGTKIAASTITNSNLAAGIVQPSNVAPAVVVIDGPTLTPLITSRAFTATGITQTCTIADPTGTPSDMQSLLIRIRDNGTAQTLAWADQWRGIAVTLPTTTTASKWTYVSAVWNALDSKWDVLSVNRQS